jgi:hypothetical protein
VFILLLALAVELLKIELLSSLMFYGIITITIAIWSWDSSVGIATGYGLNDQGMREFESR